MRLRAPATRLLTGVLALAFLTLLMRFPQAATDVEIRLGAPPGKTGEIRVPIPSFSPEVRSNGCHVRQSPDEITDAAKAGQPEVPFFALIEHATGRYAVHAGLESPEAFAKRIAP